VAIPRTTAEQWAVLAAIIDQGGYAQAGERLHRSQSAISYTLARLQESLGVELLRIEGRRAVLTAHGATLLKRARQTLEDLRELERLADSLKQGWESELRLVVDAAFPRERLLQIFAQIQRACPQTQVELTEAILSGAEEAITARAADVVIATRVPQGFLGDHLLDVDFVAVAHPQHALSGIDAISERELKQHVQVVVRDSGTEHRRDDGWLGAHRRLTVGSLESSLAMVSAGLGFAWLPRQLIQGALLQGHLRALPLITGGVRQVPLYLVVVDPTLAGPAAQAAAECFRRASRAGT
jgi:DNA-binding transcriptional LysR family regulator